MKAKMKIFYLTPEVSPFTESTDLSDSSSAFSKYLKGQGHDIRVMMPNYRSVNERKYVLRDVIRLQGLKIDLGEETFEASGKSAFVPNSKVQIYFVNNRSLFNGDDAFRDQSEGDKYGDNAKRFVFFAIACLETLKLLYWQPDIIHCNEWQTALVPLLLKTKYRDDPFFQQTKTLFTVHDMTRQGLFGANTVRLAGVDTQAFASVGDIIKDETFNFLNAGIEFADSVSLAPGGLSKQLEAKARKQPAGFPAIDYGIDSQTWNPETDKLIAANYTRDDLTGKAENRRELLTSFGLDEGEDAPILGILLTPEDDETIKLVADVVSGLLAEGIRIAVVGKPGDEAQKIFGEFLKTQPQKFAMKEQPDPKLAHIVAAGSDFLLVSSASSFFGLSQLYGQAYGAIPIVFSEWESDFIANFDEKTGKGTGFSCKKLDSKHVMATVQSALSVYQKKDVWETLTKNAMGQDFSWDAPGQEYVKLYGQLINHKTSRKR